MIILIIGNIIIQSNRLQICITIFCFWKRTLIANFYFILSLKIDTNLTIIYLQFYLFHLVLNLRWNIYSALHSQLVDKRARKAADTRVRRRGCHATDQLNWTSVQTVLHLALQKLLRFSGRLVQWIRFWVKNKRFAGKNVGKVGR